MFADRLFTGLVYPMTTLNRHPIFACTAIVLAIGLTPDLTSAQATQAQVHSTMSAPSASLTDAPSSAVNPAQPPATRSPNVSPAPPSNTSAASDASPGMLGYLPQDLSPRGMFLNADIVVQVVIAGLLLAALLTWTIWLAKSLELMVAKRRLRRAWWGLRDAQSLSDAMKQLRDGSGVARALLREAAEEWRRSAEALDDRDGLKERIALHLERVEAGAGRRMMVGTGVLATIGSTAPFVGLFGTVWGIMNSFVGISRLHTTNLAVVAPGIAEALLATACGLVAAIPAVIIYNHFTRQIGSYKALAANVASAVMALVSRDLSHNDHAIVETLQAGPPRIDPQQAPAEPAGPKPLRMVRE